MLGPPVGLCIVGLLVFENPKGRMDLVFFTWSMPLKMFISQCERCRSRLIVN